MRRSKELTGQKVGLWTVGECIRKNGTLYYHCTCDCGTQRDVLKIQIDHHKSLSCGKCMPHRKAEDLTGRKFGKLTVIRSVKDENNHTLWECRCDCGNMKVVKTSHLKSGNVCSCGCLRNESGEKIKNSLVPYHTDGTYIPAISDSRKVNKNNTSGITGVGYRKDRGKWRAYIKIKRINLNLGYYENKEDAIKARRAAEERYFKPILERTEN